MLNHLLWAIAALVLALVIFAILACFSIMNPVSQVIGGTCFAAGFLMRRP